MFIILFGIWHAQKKSQKIAIMLWYSFLSNAVCILSRSFSPQFENLDKAFINKGEKERYERQKKFSFSVALLLVLYVGVCANPNEAEDSFLKAISFFLHEKPIYQVIELPTLFILNLYEAKCNHVLWIYSII